MQVFNRFGIWRCAAVIILLLALMGATSTFAEPERAVTTLSSSTAPCLAGDNLLFLPTLLQSTAPPPPESGLNFYTPPRIPLPEGPYDFTYLPTDFNQDGKMDLLALRRGVVYVSWGMGEWEFSPFTQLVDDVEDMAVADMNGDNYPDLILATGYGFGGDDPERVLVMNGGCSRSLSSPVEILNFSASNFLLWAIWADDLNQDGKTDVILNTTDGLFVSLAVGSGFGEVQRRGLPDEAGRIEVGQLNRDGLPDLFIADYWKETQATIYTGNASGEFTPAASLDWSAISSGDLWDMELADVNGDVLDDIVLVVGSRTGESDLLVYFGQAQGQFASPLILSSGIENGVYKLAVTDIDQDSHMDLLVRQYHEMFIFRGDGTGQFSGPEQDDSHLAILVDPIANYGGDGAPDLVLTDEDENLFLLPNNGQGDFKHSVLRVARQPSAVATGDINGDGLLDILTGNGISDSLSVLLGRGGGLFGPPRLYDAGQPTGGLVVGNLNRDAYQDALATRYVSFYKPGELLIYHGNSQGELVLARTIQIPVGAGAPLIGHMNGDEWPDLVLSRCDDYNLVHEALVYLGGADGNYTAAGTHSVRNCINSRALTDLNLDGHQDFIFSYQAVANSTLREDGLAILYGDGQGNLGNPVYYPRGSDFLRNLSVGNVNGDSRPDVVVNSWKKLDVYLGNGAGALDLNAQLPVERNPEDVLLADLTGDGLSELIVTDDFDNLLMVYPNQGGSFGPPQHWPAFAEVSRVAAGDFTGDGLLDLVTGSSDSRFDQVWLYLSE